MIEGAAGQKRLNAAVTELRQGRIALGRLLGQIDMPNEQRRSMTESSRRASKAANARWASHRAKRALLNG